MPGRARQNEKLKSKKRKADEDPYVDPVDQETARLMDLQSDRLVQNTTPPKNSFPHQQNQPSSPSYETSFAYYF